MGVAAVQPVDELRNGADLIAANLEVADKVERSWTDGMKVTAANRGRAASNDTRNRTTVRHGETVPVSGDLRL